MRCSGLRKQYIPNTYTVYNMYKMSHVRNEIVYRLIYFKMNQTTLLYTQ